MSTTPSVGPERPSVSRRQRGVSEGRNGEAVLPTEPGRDRPTTATDPVHDHVDLVGRLVAGDPAVTAEIIALAPSSDDPALLVVAAVASGDRGQLGRASACAGGP